MTNDRSLPAPASEGARASPWSAIGAHFLAWIVWLWLRTLRLRVIDETGGARDDARPWVLVFFHGTQVPLLAWKRRRRTAVLVSLSHDGALQSKVMARAAMHVVRGSSSRGGARGLMAMVRALKREPMDAAFAVDGPRGPYGTVHPGATACAQRVGGVLVPIGSAASPSKVLDRAWDRFVIPWPFARCVVVLGPAIAADADADAIADAIERVNLRARQSL